MYRLINLTYKLLMSKKNLPKLILEKILIGKIKLTKTIGIKPVAKNLK